MKRLAETGNSKVTMNEMIEDMKKKSEEVFLSSSLVLFLS